MKRKKLKTLYKQAVYHMDINNHDALLAARRANPDTYTKLTATAFFAAYCHVIYTSGAVNSIFQEKMPALAQACHDFKPKKLATVSAEALVAVINHKMKATCFLKGVQYVRDEGFKHFKKRLLVEGDHVLMELPYVGEANKEHLTKDIGLATFPTDQLILDQLAVWAKAKNCKAMIKYLSDEFNEPKSVIEYILSYYCQEVSLFTTTETEAIMH